MSRRAAVAVVLREAADQDIDAAIAYLGEQSPQAALGLIDALEESFALLARQPEIGSNRFAGLLQIRGLKSLPLVHYPYTIFYLVHAQAVDVLRVLHQARDVPQVLEAD